ncbi:amidohydrolase [Pleionea mediterranea]|uniref:Amidohydrolase n=1 Tax=Pleionea mediterranea TaxID=523701 RepID=A0A316G1E2_9GAMM|nr:amidohydrolase [Pleionea mediterranea]PWK53620.1 amidohydrolase [Pleionea mediterranea]
MNIKNWMINSTLVLLTSAMIQAVMMSEIRASEVNLQDVNISADLEQQVIEWRRHLHQHPELSNREFATAKFITAHLKKLGIEVTTKVAHTGVVGLLKGAKPGPVVALRADMDALPVTERVDLPFASKATSEYNGQKVGVMHACGHDTHVAMLMGVAELLAEQRDELAGTVKFIFQPAEEGAPKGEEGGAELMVKQGVLTDPEVDVIFGLHISSKMDVGTIGYRHGGIMAAVDNFKITVSGKQVHGSTPWDGIDPVVASAQIINDLQTIVSRQLPLTKNAAVISVGSIHGGVRSNIIPESVEMVGTIRTLDPDMRLQLHEKMRNVVKHSAAVMGATAKLELPYTTHYPITYNDPELMDWALPVMQKVAGDNNVNRMDAITGAEDFSFFQQKIPGVYFFIGGKSKDLPISEAPAHHTPEFFIDESGMKLGVEVMTQLTLDYMANPN